MKHFAILLIGLFTLLRAEAQIALENWKFKTGDDPAWANPAFDDAGWATIKGNTVYENQGYDYNGYSWYRVRFKLPADLRDKSFLKDSLRVIVGRVDDIDATYLNGQKIGGIGTFPDEPGGPIGIYDALRRYALPWNHPAIRWGAENVLAVRVFDGGGGGGLWSMTPNVGMVDLIDFLTLRHDMDGFDFSKFGSIGKSLKVENKYTTLVQGTLTLTVQPKKGPKLHFDVPATIEPGGSFSHTFQFPYAENAAVSYSFSEKNTGKTLQAQQITPYILTPAESPQPFITNALVYGAHPGRPFLWAVTATGQRPMTFQAEGLPPGLALDPKTGVIRGVAGNPGEFQVELTASNSLGAAHKKVTVSIGDKINLTPPMGWNSWNCWGLSVSADRVRQSADALISSGLVNHGWTYINIDDGWQGARDSKGILHSNEKFPDMKKLSEYLHDKGLKFGLYSSPGETSCGGFKASLGHENQDVITWASWGLDYIKYDWCSYTQHLENMGKVMKSWTEDDYVFPFKKLADAIKVSGRNITLSVCNWGMGEAWKWGERSGGQLWRTSGDIEDSWASMSTIGFAQAEPGKYTHPGGWGDPDMLIVGWVGWGDKLHETRLTPSEQYTHITLWAMLSAPMIIGCDLGKLDAFTYNLLSNNEVLEINQDPLGKSAVPVFQDKDKQIWVKELHDGRKSVAVFNMNDREKKYSINWSRIGLNGYHSMRDAWRQQDLGAVKATHGVTLDAHGVALFILSK